MKTRPSSGGLRLTRIGFWFLILALIVFLAAANTGNNGLYLALATMGGMIVLAQALGAANVRNLRLEAHAPDEIFAQRPSQLQVEIENRGLLPRVLLLLRVAEKDESGGACRVPLGLVPRLPRRARHHAELELLALRRGRLRLAGIEISSLFPLGLFHKMTRFPLEQEMLVYPELFAPSTRRQLQTGPSGDRPTRRRGWGHDLLGLRGFRQGDDPRAIHWKQSARTGELIVKEREREKSRRLSIVFDNAVGELADAAERKRFERLVSEAATAAVDVLTRGWEVELVTRDRTLPYAAGRRQRRRVLEALALIEPRPRQHRPLAGATEDSHLRLAMDAEREAVA